MTQASAATIIRSMAAERRVIGAIIKAPNVLDTACSTLSPDDFAHEPYRHMFEAARAVHAGGRGLVDVVTVGEKLIEGGLLEAVGGAMELGQILADTGTTIGIEHHVRIVQQKSRRRRVVEACTGIATKAYDPELAFDEFSREFESAIRDLQNARSAGDRVLKAVGSYTDAAVERMQRRVSGEPEPGLIPTGLTDLDKLLAGGYRPGEHILVAGRPGMGKTAKMMSIINKWLDFQIRPAFFSLEMPAVDLIDRLAAQRAGVSLSDIREGRLCGHQLSAYLEAVAFLQGSGLFVGESGVSPERVAAEAHYARRVHGIDVVVVDFLTRMKLDSSKPRNVAVAAASRSQKDLALALKIPVVSLCQLNRGVESRADKRPMMSDLRDAGEIEEDADIITFLYRDEYYNVDSEDQGVVEVIVGKQRNGGPGTARCGFIAPRAQVVNLTTATRPWEN